MWFLCKKLGSKDMFHCKAPIGCYKISSDLRLKIVIFLFTVTMLWQVKIGKNLPIGEFESVTSQLRTDCVATHACDEALCCIFADKSTNKLSMITGWWELKKANGRNKIEKELKAISSHNSEVRNLENCKLLANCHRSQPWCILIDSQLCEPVMSGVNQFYLGLMLQQFIDTITLASLLHSAWLTCTTQKLSQGPIQCDIPLNLSRAKYYGVFVHNKELLRQEQK